MNTTSLLVLLIIITAIGIWSLIYSYRLGRNRQYQHDEEVSGARVRHSILLNPIFWAYLLFPVAIVLGVYLVYTFSW